MMSFWFAYLHVQGVDTLHHYSLIKIKTGMISIFISCLSLWLSELVNFVLNTCASMIYTIYIRMYIDCTSITSYSYV